MQTLGYLPCLFPIAKVRGCKKEKNDTLKLIESIHTLLYGRRVTYDPSPIKRFQVNFIFLRHFSLKASRNPCQYSTVCLFTGRSCLAEWDWSPCSSRGTRPLLSTSASQPGREHITQIHTPHLSHLVIVVCLLSPIPHQWLCCFCPA